MTSNFKLVEPSIARAAIEATVGAQQECPLSFEKQVVLLACRNSGLPDALVIPMLTKKFHKQRPTVERADARRAIVAACLRVNMTPTAVARALDVSAYSGMRYARQCKERGMVA